MPFTATPTLSGAAATLEPLSLEHAEDLGDAVREGELWRTWYTNIPSPEGMHGEIERRLGGAMAGRMAPWAVRRNSDRRLVGMTTFMNIDAANRRVEIGSTWLGVTVQRSGINRECKLLLLERAFEELDCIAVEFRTHWHNHQSRAAIARLGAKQDGVLRSHQVSPDGILRDTVVFSIISSEWPTVKKSLTEGLLRS
ncbi:GNAT family N-acetyltransferase [Planctomonas psychrotolerans]|uniref:GNAT family N-acetyltransferase n=1 Tax=Planctomonas psychrotolerans TaxID=2528712 RepID=UPI001239377D